MQIHVLASGSTGNATLIQMAGANILVDAGISARRIKNALAAQGTAVEDLDAILVTHEHRDHVAGLPTLSRKYRLPIYARPAAWQAMDEDGIGAGIALESRRELAASLDIGKLKIEPFSLSHDAADPVGFSFFHRHEKCALATDLGFVTDTAKKGLAFADALVLEANHDIDLLKQGSYPWFLKQRILGSRGHLANTDAGWTLARLPKKNNCHVLLAHLSQENNRPELAEATVANILGDQGCAVGTDITLTLTYPDKTASLK
jgi:phosphoribosyl 1,2-cyclic phosphodiesterase